MEETFYNIVLQNITFTEHFHGVWMEKKTKGWMFEDKSPPGRLYDPAHSCQTPVHQAPGNDDLLEILTAHAITQGFNSKYGGFSTIQGGGGDEHFKGPGTGGRG